MAPVLREEREGGVELGAHGAMVLPLGLGCYNFGFCRCHQLRVPAVWAARRAQSTFLPTGSLTWRVPNMAGLTDRFWFLNPMFPTEKKLIVVDVVGHLADQCTVGQHPVSAGAYRGKKS